MSSREHQLAWPKPESPAEPGKSGSGVGGPAGKNRSPGSADEVAAAALATQVLDIPGPRPAGQARRADATADASEPRVAPAVRRFVPQEAVWTTRVVRSAADFEALEGAWSALLAECEDANVFLSHEWLHSWWAAYRPAGELAIVVAEDRGRVRGIAPMLIQTVRRGGLGYRLLRFIGDGSGETDHVNFITARADRNESLPILLDAIDALRWDVAEFNQIPDASPNCGDLLGWIDRHGLNCAVERTPCPVRRLPPTFDELLASLPSRMRTSIRSSGKKLQQKHAVEFGVYTDPREIADALSTFFANHASRWQGKGQDGVFADARRRDFYARLTPRLLARGWLRFFWLKLDGRAVAQQYCFATDGTVMLLQEGFDFAHAADNVGNVLRAKVFEHLIATGASCYDFLAGTSRHKQSWSDGTVTDLRIRCARRTWRGWLFHALPRQWGHVKDVLRPWRDRLLRKRGTAPDTPPSGDPGTP